MKLSELDPNKLVVSVKMYYQGEQWELYRYVDTLSHNVQDIVAECQEEIERLAYPIAKCLHREDVAKKLTNPITDSE